MAGFVDLNIPHLAEKESLQKLVESAAHLGYSTVAINYVVDYDEKKKEIVKPISPTELFKALPLVQGKSKPIKILSRLTLVVSDPSHCNILRATSTNIKFYDIFAVFPKNGKLFHVACTTLDVDLVCINVTEKLPFYIKRPSVNVNIILSSAAEKPLQLRGPYDVANLGWLFGLSESNAKAAVSTNGRAVLLHGEARKTASGAVYTKKKPQIPEEEDSTPVSKKAKMAL
ncbi:ribonuclease P protein subunit p30 [Rhineura floridana]|uniref:ribonuclease P protein subunit p30 n=1 Tax=Rhineura floridana TaxID=261503 RepID=UPI002AC8729F|nr:ribonuclease P protein subunit p30 [Rhineura floridana]